MKIGIIGAMEEEVRLLNEKLSDVEKWTEGIAQFSKGCYADHEVYVVQSGIGKVSAAVTATLLIKHGVDILINTGSAGGLGQGLQIGDVVVADSLAYHDVDVTAFDYEMGQMAGGMPRFYDCDTKLVQLASQVAENEKLTVHHGLIVSGDQFIHSADQIQRIKTLYPEVMANEMESTAIAQVAYQFDVPFVIIRAISDTADEEASVSFDTFIQKAGEASAKMVLHLIEAL